MILNVVEHIGNYIYIHTLTGLACFHDISNLTVEVEDVC